MRAIGISVHTGCGACVVVGGSMRQPEIFSNQVIGLLEDAERFCYHRAAEMRQELTQDWLARLRAKALAKARREFSALTPGVSVGAIVARDGVLPDLKTILVAHARIHSAEGIFYRDIFLDGCQVPCRIVPPGHAVLRRRRQTCHQALGQGPETGGSCRMAVLRE